MQMSTKIELKQSPGRGLGVFAKDDISKDEVFEITPLLKLDVDSESKVLFDYRFFYPKCGFDQIYVIALGFGSLYNHSNQNNADWREGGEMIFEFFATRDIKSGEEIYLNYGGPEYFELRKLDWL